MKRYVLALDQGTTSSRAILFNKDSEIVGVAQREFPQLYPRPGWVEHEPADIWNSQMTVMRQVMDSAGARFDEVAAIGITNQRETTLVLDRNTGKPVYKAIVWQCRRTADLCEELKRRGLEELVQERTGLVIDAYFSGTKVKWILDNVPDARKRAESGDLVFGTVDTWLLWNLTRGAVAATDYTNASRTMLFDIRRLQWDEDILRELDIPRGMAPEALPSGHVFGTTDPSLTDGVEIPIASVAGDQHAALFGQVCFEPGMVKNTYGTGCFLVMNTGTEAVTSKNRLLTTIAWGLDNEVEYALEGSIFVAGAAVQWLRDEMQLIADASETEYFAGQVSDNGGVYLVPAFVGMGAPHWDMYARGTLIGITRGVNKRHVIRAALESIAYQSRDVLDAILDDADVDCKVLRADGGACVNDFLMQFQADILDLPVSRPKIIETTALGAAYLAGLTVGFWKSKNELVERWEEDRLFSPAMDAAARQRYYAQWQRAVSRAAGWEEPG
jgi:glycerol kinase